MAKYDYIKLRVDPEERAMLEDMVQSGQASTLSDAARKLAFAQKKDETEIITTYLTEISTAHGELAKLVFAQLENKELYEPDIMRMERQLAQMAKSAAKLSKAVRKVI